MTAATPGSTTETRRPRARKPQGQWLIDGRDPLNDDERIKQEDAGLAVADRIRDIYAVQGFSSIPKEDLAPASSGSASTPSASRTSTARPRTR